MFMIILSAQHHDHQLLPVLPDAASLATPYLTSFAGMQKAQMCLSIQLSEYVSDTVSRLSAGTTEQSAQVFCCMLAVLCALVTSIGPMQPVRSKSLLSIEIFVHLCHQWRDISTNTYTSISSLYSI